VLKGKGLSSSSTSASQAPLGKKMPETL
jgi:hypothetical protein